MNKSIVLFCCCFLLFLCGTSSLYAQTTGSRNITINLSEVALLDIEPNINTISFNFTAPTEAGLPILTPAANATKWLNYTSAKANATANRTVTAQINQTFPGITIKLQAGTATGGGGGTLGISTGQKSLTTTAQTIINGIGGAFTGNGANNGHQLTISTEITNYTQLVQTNNQTITITYTISN